MGILPAILLLLMEFGSSMVYASDEDCRTGFSVVVPELAVPGKTTAVLITLHGSSNADPVNITLRLLSDDNNADADNNNLLVETIQEIKGHDILALDIPSEITGSCVLQTLVNCTEYSNECDLKTSSQIRIVGPVREVIIRSEKHSYHPGETVVFWILALDHDFKLASGSIGSVSVKDPAGTKVAIWDQVSLDEGVKDFALPLSSYARAGKWQLHVEVESAEFSNEIEVLTGANSRTADIVVAEEHYVELRFGREMRRRYKPGLPFSGKVEAMSTERSVRVRVKVYDNTTSIYSQDIEITNGEGTFLVPAIMADSDELALQAELVSVESKEIENHYVLAKEHIHKWNSTSDCYLLIEGVEHSLQPEEEAFVTILSTCPCGHDLHYLITTDGRVIDWAQRRYDSIPLQNTTSTKETNCRINFSFIVQSVMAPVSQLLVYYITAQGEPVSDIISFNVKLLHKQTSVEAEDREWWLPGQILQLGITAEPDSLVCVLGGRSSGLLGDDDIRFDPRISEDHDPTDSAEEVDFLEAGVSFFQRQCMRTSEEQVRSAISYRQTGSGAGPSKRQRHSSSLIGGTSLQKLWLWKCFNYTGDISSNSLSIITPETPGKWSLWAMSVSRNGLRFSTASTLQVFSPLQIDFELPPSLKVQETLEVDIKLGNNVNLCMDVTALLALSEGAQFVSNNLLYVTERLRLGPHGATSLVVKILALTPGTKNLTVEVNGYSSPDCEGGDSILNSTLTGAILKSAQLNVHPEGIIHKTTQSAYFCANENLVVSNVDNFKYQWVTAPRRHSSIVVEFKSGSIGGVRRPVTIALAENRKPSATMYRIAIGDHDNTITWIGRGEHEFAIRLNSTKTPGVIRDDDWHTFWITWTNNFIGFGTGSSPNNNTLLEWKMNKKHRVNHIGLSSGWGILSQFRVWKSNAEAGFSQVLRLNTPNSIVLGSEHGELLVTGGLALPLVTNGDSNDGSLYETISSFIQLLQLDVEQTDQSRNLIQYLLTNIQELLAYRKLDHSFSEHEVLASHEATLLVLDVLANVQSYINIDADMIQLIKRWIQLRQEDDGRFTPFSADVKFFNGANTSSVEQTKLEQESGITAETILVLYNIGIESDNDSETLQKAKIYLENSLPKVESPETIAVVTLALILMKSATASWAIEKLRNASTTEDGEFGWPQVMTKKDAADWLYETDSLKELNEPLVTTIEEYRGAIHALTTFCLNGDIKFAESVARYLYYRSYILDQHPDLRYKATKAFSQFASLTKDNHRAVTISLATSGMELTETIELKPNKSTQILHLPSLPTKVFIYATGSGCATVQGKTTYSTYAPARKTNLLDLWTSAGEDASNELSSIEQLEGKPPMLKIQSCFKWKGSTPSGGLNLEINLFSGYELASAPQLINHPQLSALMQYTSHLTTIRILFANVTTSCPVCVEFLAKSPYSISALRPAYAKIYPTNRRDLNVEVFYHVKKGSSLLKGITQEDLDKWFSKNINGTTEFFKDLGEKCNGTNLELFTTNSDVQTTQIPKYTTTKPIISTETVLKKVNYTSTVSTTVTAEMNEDSLQKFDQFKVTTYTINVDNDSFVSFNENDTRITDKRLIAMTNIESNDIEDLNGHEIVKNISFSSKPKSTTPSMVATEKIPIGAKHVNTKIHEIPLTQMRLNENLDGYVRAFPPSNKSDTYILLDKADLWNLLKEVVDDQVKKSAKIDLKDD